MTDMDAFKLGENIGRHSSKVVYQNDLIQFDSIYAHDRQSAETAVVDRSTVDQINFISSICGRGTAS